MRRLLALTFLALALGAGAARADLTIGGLGGMAFPQGRFHDAVGSGFLGGGFADWWFSEFTAIGAEYRFSTHESHGALERALAESGHPRDAVQFEITQITGHWKRRLSIGTVYSTWLGLGLGAYRERTKTDLGLGAEERNETEFGYAVSSGVDFVLNDHVALGGFVSYHTIPDGTPVYDASGSRLDDSRSAEYFALGVCATFGRKLPH